MADEKKDDKKEKVPNILSMPNWVWAVLIIGVLVFLVVNTGGKSPVTTANTTTNSAPNTTDSMTHDVVLPDNVIEINVSPSAPKAGDEITFTASVIGSFANIWKDNFSYELWVRQFGNWQKTSCYSSPCTYVFENASQGTLEYKIVRTAKDGSISEEGSYYLDVATTTQTGDTLGPKVTVFHSPQNPRVGQTVSIEALVNDISGLEKVDIYVDGEIVKTCPQKVKISQCQVSISNLEVGTHEYYAYSIDTFGNETTSSTLSYTVVAS